MNDIIWLRGQDLQKNVLSVGLFDDSVKIFAGRGFETFTISLHDGLRSDLLNK